MPAMAILAALRWAVHYAKFLQRHGHVAEALAELTELPLSITRCESTDPRPPSRVSLGVLTLGPIISQRPLQRLVCPGPMNRPPSLTQRGPQYLSIRHEAQKHHNEQVLRQPWQPPSQRHSWKSLGFAGAGGEFVS